MIFFCMKASHVGSLISGGGDRTTSPPLYLLDPIDVSSLLKEGIFRKAAFLYAEGHSLHSISRDLEVSRTLVRKAIARSDVDHRAREKRKNGYERGAPPYGYALVGGRLVEDPKEQQIVRRILALWNSGKTFHAIAETLNRQKIRPRTARTWKYATIQKIIRRQEKN
jgi:hypothetical protein